MGSRRTVTSGLLLAAFLSCSSSVSAQIRSAVLVGNVVDPSGDPVPNARIAVVAQDTNARDETSTNAVGQYTVPYLPPGSYGVIVTVPGFAPARVTGISLGTNQTVRADVKLEFNTVATSVEVNANVAEL